jgi:hypothetical protein
MEKDAAKTIVAAAELSGTVESSVLLTALDLLLLADPPLVPTIHILKLLSFTNDHKIIKLSCKILTKQARTFTFKQNYETYNDMLFDGLKTTSNDVFLMILSIFEPALKTSDDFKVLRDSNAPELLATALQGNAVIAQLASEMLVKVKPL